MTENEFFYWLQGYFELHNVLTAGTPPLVLTLAQAECIGRHAALVRTSGATPGKAFGRVEFLAELIQDPLLQPDGRGEFTRKMQAEVAGQFQHVIDPKAGGPEVQAELQAIHDGPMPGPYRPFGNPVYRC